MLPLKSYSLETDSIVLLTYTNGQQHRVAYDRLDKYLSPIDVKKIQNAYTLRNSFIKTHSPRTKFLAFGLTGAGVAAVAIFTIGGPIASTFADPYKMPPALNEQIVRNSDGEFDKSSATATPQQDASVAVKSDGPTPTPVIKGSTLGASTAAQPTVSPKTNVARTTPTPKPVLVASPSPTSAPAVVPVITPAPMPEATQSPEPTPTETSQPIGNSDNVGSVNN